MSRQLARESAKRLEKLRRTNRWVDTEYQVSQGHQHRERIEEVLRLIRPAIMKSSGFPFCNLPFHRNAAFYPRSAILQVLRDHLKPGTRPTSLLQAGLVGLGGAGKTQIVLEFAHSVIDMYDVVLWFASESITGLGDSFGRVAVDMGLVKDDSSQPLAQRQAALKNWLVEAGHAGD